jgi:predicted RNase H-like HicB family nuclease
MSCPALPGCPSQGDPIEEALENIKDAIQGCMGVINQRALKGIKEKAFMYRLCEPVFQNIISNIR